MAAGQQNATPFEGMSEISRRVLMLVTGIDLAMFVLEMGAGHLAGSQSLEADALDFLAGGLAYALSFWAIGRPAQVQAGAAVLKGIGLVAIGLWIGVTTLYQFFTHAVPVPEVMGGVGLVALVANGVAVWLLLPQRDREANLRAASVGARNDTIGNVAVIIAAGLVAVLGNGAPDLIVAGVMVVLFLGSSGQALAQGWRDWRHGAAAP